MIYNGIRIKGEDYIQPNTEKVLSLTAGTPYGELSPYLMKRNGIIMENEWQFSKLYEAIPSVNEREHRYSDNYWSWPGQVHVDRRKSSKLIECITPEYFEWRRAGMECSFPVRYPVGYEYRHKCIGCYFVNSSGKARILDYITSRKKLYIPLYLEIIEKLPLFHKLLSKVKSGTSITIVEVDGPHQESLPYYKEKYNMTDDFIVNHVMESTIHNLDIMLQDDKHPFGHGYCLAVALLRHLQI